MDVYTEVAEELAEAAAEALAAYVPRGTRMPDHCAEGRD
jgi:hypothetical protein